MTSPKGMDELLWGKKFENIHDWVQRLEMVVEVRRIDEQKLFKIGRLKLRGKAKEWFKKITITLTNWPAMKVAMLLKYGIMDMKKLRPNLTKSSRNQDKDCKRTTIEWKSFSQGANWRMLNKNTSFCLGFVLKLGSYVLSRIM
jgi:hypothetical protein